MQPNPLFRPPKPDRKDLAAQAPFPRPPWWKPLASKLGLLGVIIFVGVLFQAWDAAQKLIATRDMPKQERSAPASESRKI